MNMLGVAAAAARGRSSRDASGEKGGRRKEKRKLHCWVFKNLNFRRPWRAAENKALITRRPWRVGRVKGGRRIRPLKTTLVVENGLFLLSSVIPRIVHSCGRRVGLCVVVILICQAVVFYLPRIPADVCVVAILICQALLSLWPSKGMESDWVEIMVWATCAPSTCTLYCTSRHEIEMGG